VNGMECFEKRFVLKASSNIVCNDRIIDYDKIKGYMSKILNEIKESYNPIAIFLDRNEFLLISILALIEKKIPYVPIDINYPIDRIEFILNDCNIDTVISQTKYLDKFKGKNVINIDEVKNRKICPNLYEESKEKGNFNNLEKIYILYTSGSTGKPKGVEVSRENIASFMEGICERIDFSPNRRILCHTVATFDIFFLESILPLYRGMTVVLANDEEHKNPKKLTNLIIENSIDMLQMTPSKIILLNNYDKELLYLQGIKNVLVGGEKFPLSLLKILQEKTKTNIYNMYGPTETSIWSTVSNLTEKSYVDIGTPIKNANVYIVDENFHIIKDRSIGEICICGKVVCRGYLNNISLTNEKFIELPELNIRGYLTGDFGKLNSNGDIEYLYRKDNQIKLNGHRIEIEEIESVLDEIPEVIQNAVVKIAINEEDNDLVAFYTSEKDISNEIKDYLSNKLPSYMIPSRFIKINELSNTSNSKIDRNKLTELYFRLEKNNVKAEIDNESVEGRLIGIIGANILLEENFSILPDNELSYIGINSITFIKVIVAIENEFDFEFDDDKLSNKSFTDVKSIIEYVKSKIE
jgi:amino acid adenylation domain-containing protein